MSDSSMPWVKIYTEMLDDTKLGRISERARWRFVQLVLMAGECDAEGYLVNGDKPMSTDDIAWRLRLEPAKCAADMASLENIGLITNTDGGWYIPKFAARQGRSQSEKREIWRRNQARTRSKNSGHEWETKQTPAVLPPVIGDTHVSHTPRGEKRREEERRGEEEGASAPSPEPKPKAPVAQKAAKPLAVLAYQDAAGSLPAKTLWDSMDEAIGTQPEDLKFWGTVVRAWIAKGWNPRNLSGMFDFFKRRELPPAGGNGHGKQPATPVSSVRTYTDANGQSRVVLSPEQERIKAQMKAAKNAVNS